MSEYCLIHILVEDRLNTGLEMATSKQTNDTILRMDYVVCVGSWLSNTEKTL